MMLQHIPAYLPSNPVNPIIWAFLRIPTLMNMTWGSFAGDNTHANICMHACIHTQSVYYIWSWRCKVHQMQSSGVRLCTGPVKLVCCSDEEVFFWLVDGFLRGFLFLHVYICGHVAASADGLLHSTICAEDFLVIRVHAVSHHWYQVWQIHSGDQPLTHLLIFYSK